MTDETRIALDELERRLLQQLAEARESKFEALNTWRGQENMGVAHAQGREKGALDALNLVYALRRQYTETPPQGELERIYELPEGHSEASYQALEAFAATIYDEALEMGVDPHSYAEAAFRHMAEQS